MEVRIMSKIEEDMRLVVRLVAIDKLSAVKSIMSRTNNAYHMGYRMGVSGYTMFRSSQIILQGNFLYGS